MTLRFGTRNVPVGAARVDAILAFLISHCLDILALQELFEASRVRFRAFWTKKGYHVSLGACNPLDKQGKTRVAILSRIPMREICPEGIGEPHRACFGLVEVRCDNGIRKLCIGSIYGHARNPDARQILCHQVLHFLNMMSSPWLEPGDWNTTVEACELAPHVASGIAFSLGDCFIDFRKNGTSCIDFGLSSGSFIPVERVQCKGLADHDLVVYGFDYTLLSGHSAPARNFFMMQILTRLRLTSKRSGIPFLSLRGLRMDWWMRHGVCCRMLLSVFFVQWLDLAMARLERSARLLQSILVATRRQQLRNLCSCAGCADCSGRSFNDGAGCKVLDHLHLCCVCLQLYIPPSEITKHSMQLPSTYEPLHCAAPVPVYACLSLCVDIVF